MRGLTPGYIVRRVLICFFTIWLGATLIFIIPRLVPGDPVSAMVGRQAAMMGRNDAPREMVAAWRTRFGLDDPLPIQYVKYLGNMATLNLGYSLSHFPETVWEMIARNLPWTVGLLLMSTLISFAAGTVIGTLMGWRVTPKALKAVLPFFLVFTAVPYWMLGLMLIFIFGFGLRWFPILGGYGRETTIGWNWAFIQDAIWHSVLPATAMIITSMGFWAIGMRGMMIANECEDYLILAQAKGLSRPRLFWFYAVHNAILPQITSLAMNLANIVGGVILVEYVFVYPGVGFLLYRGFISLDYTLIQGVCFILIVSTAFAVLVLDLLYPLIDPRISYLKR